MITLVDTLTWHAYGTVKINVAAPNRFLGLTYLRAFIVSPAEYKVTPVCLPYAIAGYVVIRLPLVSIK